jgi:hypothetical protein
MMEAVSTSETSVNFYQTTRLNIPEDSRLHYRHGENLISHTEYQSFKRVDSGLHRKILRKTNFVFQVNNILKITYEFTHCARYIGNALCLFLIVREWDTMKFH